MDSSKQIKEINLDDILPNRLQPRKVFDEEKLRELASSIKEHGVISPIYVRPVGDKYEIIAGERRYKASEMAGKTNIPAIVAELSDKESAEIALIENIQRQDLSPIDEAVSIKTILDRGYLTQTNLAARLGKSQAAIANKMRLLNLTDDVQEALINNRISERHARSLLKLSNKEQIDLLNRIIKERLTVRKTEEEIKKILNGETKEEKIEELFLDVSAKKEDEKMENNEAINPGFMDINKIEQESTEIYPKKEAAPIEELLDNSKVELTPEIPKTIEDEAPLSGGKFFNFTEEVKEEEPINPFLNNQIKEEPVTNNILEASEPVTNLETEPINQTVIKEQEDELLTPTIPKMEVEDVFNVPTETKVEAQTPQLETLSIEEPVTIEKPSEMTPMGPREIFEDIEPFYGDVPEEPKASESFFANVVPAYETEPVIVPTKEEPKKEEFVDFDIVEEPKQQPQTTAAFGADLKTVLSTIRNCASTIEKYGYIIDLEEFDLENMYQVIFKINKKK